MSMETATQAPRIMMVAGEASGDMYGGHLARALGQVLPGASLWGMGGPAMAAAGVELPQRMERLSVMGFAEVVPKLADIFRLLRELKAEMARRRPGLLITIDSPDFNLRLAPAAKRLGIPVLHYIGPQVWAWRPRRANRLEGLVDALALILPFEAEFWHRQAPKVPVEFVGHPLLDEMAASRAQDREPLELPAGRVPVGLLPGSRRGEIARLAPVLAQAASLMQQARGDLHFWLPVAPGLTAADLAPHLVGAPAELSLVPARAVAVMSQARASLVASGTATLQAALCGNPFTVLYRTAAFSAWMARRLLKIKYAALPNLIAGREMAREFLQEDATPQNLATQGLALLADGPQRQAMIRDLAEIAQRLGGTGASLRVAQLAARLLAEKA